MPDHDADYLKIGKVIRSRSGFIPNLSQDNTVALIAPILRRQSSCRGDGVGARPVSISGE
jgi:hypothetical protein